MSRDKNDGQEGVWLTPNADKRRLRDAENARKTAPRSPKHCPMARFQGVIWSNGACLHAPGFSRPLAA